MSILIGKIQFDGSVEGGGFRTHRLVVLAGAIVVLHLVNKGHFAIRRQDLDDRPNRHSPGNSGGRHARTGDIAAVAGPNTVSGVPDDPISDNPVTICEVYYCSSPRCAHGSHT